MKFSLLVESGATKTDIIAYGHCYGEQKESSRYKIDTFYKPNEFIRGVVESAEKGLKELGGSGLSLDSLELSSAGIVKNGHIKTTNSGGLEYSLEDIAEAFRSKGVRLSGTEMVAYNDMQPGAMASADYLMDEAEEINFEHPMISVLRKAKEERWSDNMVYAMPGGGYGVLIAPRLPDGDYLFNPGEGGHFLIGDRGDSTDREIVDYLKAEMRKEAKENREVEVEHAIGGNFIHHLFNFYDGVLGEDGINFIKSRMVREGAGPAISKEADSRNKAAQTIMKKATQFYVRSLIDYSNIHNAGIVVLAGHFMRNSQYAQNIFNDVWESEALGRIHEDIYKNRINAVLVEDDDINMNGLRASARKRFKFS